MGGSVLTVGWLSSAGLGILAAMADAHVIGPRNSAGFRRPPERLLPNPKAKLREQFHEVCRFKHLSARTEETYWGSGAPVSGFPPARPGVRESKQGHPARLHTGNGGD
jgi:hypothetical protein